MEGWGCFNNTLQGVRNRVGGGDGGGFFIFFAPQTKAQFLSGLKRGVGAHRQELEFLERGGLQLFLMTVCLHGCSTTFQGKCGAGLVVTGLERNGPEENL